jgi:two-component system OmpR family sensor kinase
VEMGGSSGVPRRPHWIVPLLAALLFLGLGARIVSRRIARPLESVAHAATRFGEGDLASRTGLGDRPRRWVAEEVRDVARAFDTMAGRIEGVVREQRELLGAISHELRSPIGRARIALEIARDRSAPAPSPQLDEIERQLVDVDAILGDLLAAARAGLADLHAQPTSLLAWLRKQIAAEPMPPAIELRADDVELDVLLEPALMNRALHNLFANARAHGHPSALPLEVKVEVEGDGGARRVRVIVRDRGPGFAPDLLTRAFEPFVKGDAARTPGAGSGLGLALVRRIVEAHGGRAFARNAVDATAVTGAIGGDDDGGDGDSEGGAEVGFELPLEGRRGA